jgi:predicted DNA-binding antitoxin AbrB/MazE fold protein
MDRVVEAIYEDGTLRPLEALDLPEHQRVRITIHNPGAESPDETYTRGTRCTQAARTRRSCRLGRLLGSAAVSCGRGPNKQLWSWPS